MATLNTTAAARGELASDQQIAQLLAQNWWAFAIRGVLGIIFGLIAFLQPGVTMLSLVLVFSAYAFVDGVLQSLRRRGRHGSTSDGDFCCWRVS